MWGGGKDPKNKEICCLRTMDAQRMLNLLPPDSAYEMLYRCFGYAIWFAIYFWW